MTKKRRMGKVLPLYLHRAENAPPDQIKTLKGSVNRGAEADPAVSESASVTSNGNRVQLEVTLDLDPWSDEAWQASLTGVESDLVSDLFGTAKPEPKANEITMEEVQWLLKRPLEPDSEASENECEDLTGSLGQTGTEEETVFGLPAQQLAQAQKNGSLTDLLAYRYRSAAQFPVLDKIMSTFASGATKRLRNITGQACSVVPVRSARAPFDVWLRMDHPIATTFSMYPLEGVGMIGIERELAVGLMHSTYSAGGQESVQSMLRRVTAQKSSKGGSGCSVAYSIMRHVLHLLLLDMEWALAPFYEVESTHGRADEQAWSSKHFWLDEPCIVCEFSVSMDAESHTGENKELSGTMMMVFPEKMLKLILPILSGEQEILVPEFSELDASAIECFTRLDDAALRDELAQQHPLSSAVILSQLSEDRRNVLLETMDREKREAIERRAGHRAGIEVVLSESQQFVASVLALGESHAAQVLRSFSPEAAAGFLREAGKLPSLYAEQVNALLKQRNSSIVSVGALVVDSALVRRLMIRAIAAEDMSKVVALCRNDRIHMPFAPVRSVPAQTVAAMLRSEPVAIQRAVVALLLKTDREYAAQLLGAFEPDEQQAIVCQLEYAKRIEPEFITLLENSLVRELETGADTETLAMPEQEQWATSGTVEWLLNEVGCNEKISSNRKDSLKE